MSQCFQDILQRELQAQNVAPACLPAAARALAVAPPARRSPGAPAGRMTAASVIPAVSVIPAAPAAPAAPAVSLAFSPQARQLSSSLQHYAVDPHRTARRDSGILAGNSESGCIWKSEQGLSGEMRFTTENGQHVRIAAGSAPDEPSWDVRVEVTCAGKAYDFALEELATASAVLDVPFCLALESASPCRPEAGPQPARPEAPAAPVYSARGVLRYLDTTPCR